MEYDIEELINKAISFGFSKAVKLNMDSLIFNTDVRDMCSADRCHSYNKSWSCPPSIGTVEDSFNRTKDYKDGIIVECIYDLEDDFDYESMEKGAIDHQKMMIEFNQVLKKEGYDSLTMGSGGCRICAKCSYPDEPCRFPDKKIISMEAYGLYVYDVCKKSGIKYNNGPLTITYIGCVLFK